MAVTRPFASAGAHSLEARAELAQPREAALAVLDVLERAARPAGVIGDVVAVQTSQRRGRKPIDRGVEAADPGRGADDRRAGGLGSIQTLGAGQVLDQQPAALAIDAGAEEPRRRHRDRLEEAL